MVHFIYQCTNFTVSSQTMQHISLQQIQIHTNVKHVNKTPSSSLKEGFVCILQSNSWLGLREVCQVGSSWCKITVMLSKLTVRQRGVVCSISGLSPTPTWIECSQAKYMVRRVSWWTWTALAKAWWSRPLLWPDVWLPSALKYQDFSWTFHKIRHSL